MGKALFIAEKPSVAQEFAKTLSVSTEVLTKEEYKKRFGRELVW